MGVFSRKKKNINIAKVLYGDNFRYFVWNYAQQIDSIPEVRNAVECFSNIFATIPIYNERVSKDGIIEYKEDSLTRLLNYKPNPLQSATQFKASICAQLLYKNNVFIEPRFDDMGNVTALYLLPFNNPVFSVSDDGTKAYVQFIDSPENPSALYDMDNVIYLNRFSTIMGGKKNELGLYETVLKSLAEHLVNYSSPKKARAILQSNVSGQGALKEKDRKGVMSDMSSSFDETVDGIAYVDKQWSITPINWNDNVVNKEIQRFVTNIVYNYFGINENIINNTASEIEMAMFVKTRIRPIAEMCGQEFTNKLFTANEYFYGRRIEFDWSPLLVTTLTSEANAAQIYLRSGVWSIDEARERINYMPLENGLGIVHRASADLVNVEIIDEYEASKVSKTVTEIKNKEQNNDDETERIQSSEV